MLVKNGFEGISHFMNHPEMLPYVGYARDVLYVGECVSLPEVFVDKSDLFQNWYEEPTPKILDGFSEQEWRMAKVYFDLRQIISRHYDKYANPKKPRLLEKVTNLYSKIADSKLKRYLNEHHMYDTEPCDMGHMEIIYARKALNYDLEQDARERFLQCSYYTYFQRPNLTAGEFQEIMPNEDKKAFEIFLKVLDVIKPRLVIVMSAKASESIRKHLAEELPCKILLFDSTIPLKWNKEERKKFKQEIGEIFTEKAKNHLKNWIRATGTIDNYFTTAIDEVLIGQQFRNRNSLESLDKLIATNAAELIKKSPDDKKSAWFNCHPLNIGEEKIFPLFLAICRGEEKLETTFEKMLEQAQKIIKKYPESRLVKRNIVLLTDKWDKNLFQNYQSKFSKYKGKISFIFGYIKKTEIKTVGGK